MPKLTQRVGLVLLLFLVGKVKDNLKLGVWDEPMQKSFVVVGVLAVVETGNDDSLCIGQKTRNCPRAIPFGIASLNAWIA